MLEQLSIFKKNVIDLLPEDVLITKLKKGNALKVKLGADPSAPDLHLGHAVILRKLRDLQNLGHRIIFLIGDFTAMIGDPTGKNETRKPLSKEDILKNAKTYTKQVFKILDESKTEIRFNSEWLSELKLEDIIKISSHVTIAQILERDDFSKRFYAQRPISFTEFMYPIAQAYDSVALESDLELGGTDQKFNLLLGRSLQNSLGQESQCILTMPILEGTDGQQKMSKSLGNYIGLMDSPENMFGKIMSIPDTLIEKYFNLLTEWDLDSVKKRFSDGENPRNMKIDLAQDIVTQYHSREDAVKALEHFNNLFKNKGVPEYLPEYKIDNPSFLVDCLFNAGLEKSKGAIRRLITQNAVSVDGQKIQEDYLVKETCIIRMGKLKFVKIILEK